MKGIVGGVTEFGTLTVFICRWTAVKLASKLDKVRKKLLICD